MNIKKIALIALFLVVTAGIAYMLYRFFFAGEAPAPTTPPGTVEEPGAPAGGLPAAQEGRPPAPSPEGDIGLPPVDLVARGGFTATQTVSGGDAVLKPILSETGQMNYYNRTDGKFYRQLEDGSVAALSQKVFPDARDVDWSPKADKAIIEFPDDSKIIYNFATQQQVTLPKHWEDFDFNGEGDSVAAKSMGLDPANRWLITFDANGQSAQLIEPLGENADKVIVDYSPDSSVVAFSDTADPVGFDSHDMLLVGRNGENFKSMRVEGFDFIPEWSPSSKYLLYSAAGSDSGYLPTLWFSAAKGQDIGAGRTNLGVHTWADKCTYANEETVYCAVPNSLPDGAGLQRDVANGTPDSIVKIDLRNGTQTNIARPSEDTSISELSVSADESKLFFTEASGALVEMRLK